MNSPAQFVDDDENDSILFERLQQNALDHYSNPRRLGCPSHDILNRFVAHPVEVSTQELKELHIFHCAECTRELMRLRLEREHPMHTSWMRSVDPRHHPSRWLGAAVCIILGMVLLTWRPLERRASGKPRSVEVTVLIKNSETLRGPTAGVKLPRKRLNIHIALPPGSLSGQYRITITRKQSTYDPLLSANAIAGDSGAGKVVTSMLDLRALPSGGYWMGVSPNGMDRTAFFFVILK